MATLTVANYGDLMNAVKKDYGPPKIQTIIQNYVDYPLFQLFFKKERMKTDGGQLIQRNLHLKKDPVAKFRGIGEPDTVKINDMTAQASVPWRFASTDWGFFDADILLAKSSEHKIFDLIDTRRNNAYVDIIEMLEAALWSVPATTDTKTIYGVPYYVVKNGTTGFTGTVPSGYSDVAGVSTTTYPNWRNRAGLYTSVTKADLIKKLRTAMRLCRFRDLEMLDINDYRRGRDKYVLFCNETTTASLEDIGEAQNENLGRDLAVMEVNSTAKDVYRTDGVLTFRRKPIMFAPYLDGDSSDPVYGLSMDTFCMYIHEDRNFTETDALRVADTHDTWYVVTELYCQLLCIDRRRNFVLATSA